MNLLTRANLPAHIADEDALEELLSRPSRALIDDLQRLDGDHPHSRCRRQGGSHAGATGETRGTHKTHRWRSAV